MREWLVELERYALRLYSSDAAFVLGYHLAVTAVLVLLLTVLLLAIGSYIPTVEMRTDDSPADCVYFAGQCW